MKFGEKLSAQLYEPWAEHYLDYELLKAILKAAEEDTDNGAAAENGSHADLSMAFSNNINSMIVSNQYDPVTLEFLGCLDTQLEKIMVFVLEEQGSIAKDLRTCRDRTVWNASCEAVLYEVYKEYQQIGVHILRLIQFLDLNVTGIRKILKKHDKCMSTRLSGVFFLSQQNANARLHGTRLVEPLLVQDNNIGALAAILEAGLSQLQWHRHQVHVGDHPYIKSNASLPQTEPTHQRQNSDSNIPKSIVTSTLTSMERLNDTAPQKFFHNKLFSGYRSITSLSSIASLQQFFRSDSAPMRRLPEPILYQIETARDQFNESKSVVDMLASRMLFEDDQFQSETSADFDDSRKSPISDTLNLLSTFLYLTNYYIVAPTSGSYARKLGANESLSSMIIGMTPVAALFSTLLFSWWSSYSYRHALIFASSCSLIGNVLYAAGLPYNSLSLVLFGRLLNGFGSARSINRRYIADRFSRKDRTAASATFVTAGALGMAAGPAISALLNIFTPRNSTNIYWQFENAPGWFMAIMWTLFLIAMLLKFENPVKRPEIAPKTEANEELSEKSPLVEKNGNQEHGGQFSQSPEKPFNINVPAMATFVIYFILKLMLEAILSSSSTLAVFYFDWNSTITGVYLALLGLLMLPANLAVSLLAKRFEDRELIICLLSLTFIGCIGVLQYSAYYPLAQYLIASLVIFVSTNALEGPNMSLLSKTIPKSWSRGILNVGLLATEAGTFGRVVADVLLSFFGSAGPEHVLNRTFGTFSLLSGFSLFASVLVYDQLEPTDLDD